MRIEATRAEERAARLQANKLALRMIWHDLMITIAKLKAVKCPHEKKRLLNEYRILNNKYAFSNGIDDTINHRSINQ